MKRYITKTIFVEAQKCIVSAQKLYHKIPGEISPELQFIFDIGNYVNDENHRLSTKGVLIEGTNTFALKETQRVLPTAETIFEATFAFEDCLVRIDQLNKTPGGYEIIEVKSATSVKPEYLQDTAFQYYVATKCGLNITRVVLRHPSSEGGFEDHDLTNEALELQPNIELSLMTLREVLDEALPPVAEEACLSCPFASQCFPQYKELIQRGYTDSQNLDCLESQRSSLEDHELNPRQTKLKELLKNQSEYVSPQLAELLNFPNFYVLDFEAFHHPLRGYARLPFLAGTVEVRNHQIISTESFYHEDLSDLTAMANYLKNSFKEDYPILAFSMGYEKSVLTLLQKLTAVNLESVIARLVDPLPSIRAHYYHRDLNYSFSLKALTRLLLPKEKDYKNLTVQNGTGAQGLFLQRLRNPGSCSATQIQDLKTYCEADVRNTADVVLCLQKKLAQ